jgi:predicted RNA-binding protein with PIN domain
MTTHEKILHCCSEVKYEHIKNEVLITAVFEKETITSQYGTLYFSESRLWEIISENIQTRINIYANDIKKAKVRNRLDKAENLQKELDIYEKMYGVMIR